MKRFIRIILALVLLLNGSGVIHSNETPSSLTDKQQRLYTSAFWHTGAKLFSKPHFRRINRLLATENEEDSESNSGKKHVTKAIPVGFFVNANHCAAYLLKIDPDLVRSKLLTAFAPNKVYLALKVFRL